MTDITSANAVYMLAINGLYPTPIALVGFSADDIFDTTPARVAEVVMGVDGRLSAGFVPYLTEQGVFLQADSPSVPIFENWNQQSKLSRSMFPAFGNVILPSIGRKYTMSNGILTTYPAISDAKKILQPRKFIITWEDVSPAPM